MERLRAEIDLDALRNNVELSARRVGSGVGIIAVVKADAYGHGAVEVSRGLASFPAVKMLGVSSVEEGLELRESGIFAPILVMGVATDSRVPDAVSAGITLSVFTEECLVSLSEAAKKCGRAASYHLKIDTGMARLGLPEKDCFSLMEKARNMEELKFEGIFTHLAYSSCPQPEPTFEQISRFNSVVSEFEKSCLPRPRLRHMANSAAVQRFSESFCNMVRPGIMLYGSSFEKQDLVSVMRVKSSVVRLRKLGAGEPVGYGGTFTTKKPSIIAVIPVGYRDGYFRRLSNRSRVSIKGVAAPVVGEVCMDFTTVDVTGIQGIQVGDEAVLFGSGGVSVEDVAKWAETIPYEIMTVMGGKISRKIYKRDTGTEAEN